MRMYFGKSSHTSSMAFSSSSKRSARLIDVQMYIGWDAYRCSATSFASSGCSTSMHASISPLK